MRQATLSHLFSGLMGFLAGGALIFAVQAARALTKPERLGWVSLTSPRYTPPPKKSVRKLKLGPEWRLAHMGPAMESNVSFLNSREMAPTGSFADTLLPSGRALQLRQEFEDIQRSYDLRRQAGLAKYDDEANQYNQRMELAKKVRNEIRREQVRNGTGKAKSAALRDENVAQPAKIAAAVAAMGTGYPVKAAISDEVNVTASASVPQRTSYLQLNSPLVNTTFSMAGDPATGSADQLSHPLPEWFRRDERYYLSMNRALPIWDLGAGISYGDTSSTLSTSVSKALTPNLNAEVSHRMPVQDRSLLVAPQDSFSINYKVNF